MSKHFIEADYFWNADEYVIFHSRLTKYKGGFWLRFGEFFLVVFLLFLGLVSLRDGGQHIGGAIIFLPCAALCIYNFYLGGRKRSRLQAFRRQKTSAGHDQHIQFMIDEQDVRMFDAATDTTWKWFAVDRVIQFPEGYSITLGNVYRWLPNHAFRDEADRLAFQQVATLHAGEFVPLR